MEILVYPFEGWIERRMYPGKFFRIASAKAYSKTTSVSDSQHRACLVSARGLGELFHSQRLVRSWI